MHPYQPDIRLENLNKRFGATVALANVSLEIQSGERVVLLGLSGSGKSTLLRHLNGLETPDSGAIEVLGEAVERATGKSLRNVRRRVGFVFQQFELVGPRTVLENVLTGALAGLRGPRLGLFSYPKALRIRAAELLEEVGLSDRAFQRADTLSGGQQQRVAIARALMQNPSILLADEPVASLDPESSHQVMSLLNELAERRNLTVVCSLHQVELALSWGSRVIGLRAGEVVLDGMTANLDQDEVMTIYKRISAADHAHVKTEETTHYRTPAMAGAAA